MSAIDFKSTRKFWFQRSEAALNWVALGMLLAAWNVCDNATPADRHLTDAQRTPQRPAKFGAYAYVSVRAYKSHETVN